MDIQNIINIIAIVLSPIIAVLITRYLSIRTDKKKDKMEIFKILMATRYNRCTIEYVRALNSIDVVFYDSKKVRKAWSDYYSVLQHPTPNSNLIFDKELLLTLYKHKMGKCKVILFPSMAKHSISTRS